MVTRTKKIFVGGLSANTVVEDVKQYFEQFGKVSSSVGQCDTLCILYGFSGVPKDTITSQQLDPYCIQWPFQNESCAPPLSVIPMSLSPLLCGKETMLSYSVLLVPEPSIITLWVTQKSIVLLAKR